MNDDTKRLLDKRVKVIKMIQYWQAKGNQPAENAWFREYKAIDSQLSGWVLRLQKFVALAPDSQPSLYCQQTIDMLQSII